MKKLTGTTYTDEAIKAANNIFKGKKHKNQNIWSSGILLILLIFKGLTYDDVKRDQNVLIFMTDGVLVWFALLKMFNILKKEDKVFPISFDLLNSIN